MRTRGRSPSRYRCHSAPAILYFTPAQVPAAGTAYDPNLSPLCQYSADDGHVTLWRLAHLGGILTRGPGLSFVEATVVVPEGRKDSQIESLPKIVEFAHPQNQKIGAQLAHAGRKASTVAPWLHPGMVATEKNGGWPDNVWGPSTVSCNENFPVPKELSKAQIKGIVVAFVGAARRALEAGVDVVEIHNTHGYLLFTFPSPQSNKRTHEYRGSFENRIRLTLEVVDPVRDVIPNDMPFQCQRVSATEWLEEALPNEPYWRFEDTVKLADILAQHSVDFLDVCGNHPKAIVKRGPAYQAPSAHAGCGHVVQGVLDKGQADVVLIGRYFQKNPGAVWSFASDLGVGIKIAHQIEWAFAGRGGIAKKLVW
ncbi:hypothetical protein BU15DRAFT_89535 [Melanogaster broomeanus]|nr:hypothetical protein BU15DRAFT_89535 [Melanogaster broomeanus]